MENEDDLVAVYGDIVLSFSHYYKFCFFFTGESDKVSVVASIGGCAEDIYKYSLSFDDWYPLSCWPHEFDRIEVTCKTTGGTLVELSNE